MFKRKDKIEVIPPHMYTDFSDRVPGDAYATRKDVAIAALSPVALGAPIIAYNILNKPDTYTAASIPVTAPVIEPVNVIANPTPTNLPIDLSTATPEMIPTGFIADSSLEMLATVLDPLVQIMMAVSFPIASVIMIGGSFFFLLGNSEKAWQIIFNSALGYIIIQMSPLFLDILKSVGESV